MVWSPRYGLSEAVGISTSSLRSLELSSKNFVSTDCSTTTRVETDLVTNIAAGWTAFIYSMCLS